MLNELTPSQQMFMLFFSILYGIMLNSVIGLRAFPLASAFARKDYVGKRSEDFSNWKENWKENWKDGHKSLRRLILSFILLNILPFVYFAVALQYIDKFIENLPPIVQVVFIGLMSLGVFAFYRFFIGLAILKRKGNHIFYTESEFQEHVDTKERRLYLSTRHYVLVGFVYLTPWLVMMSILILRPFFCN